MKKKKIQRRTRIIIALYYLTYFLLLNKNIIAREYYVSKKGMDNQPGTITKPLLSINKALDKVLAGDSIYVRKGIYQEYVWIKQSGSKGKPILLKSYQEEKVILDGSSLAKHSKGIRIGSWGSPVKYIEVEGFEIRNYGKSGVEITPGTTNCKLINIYSHQNGYEGFYLFDDKINPEHKNYQLVINCRADFNASHGFKASGNNILILNCHAQGNTNQGLQLSITCKDIVVDGGNYYQNGRNGIRVAGKQILIKNVNCYLNKRSGIQTCERSHNITVLNSISHNNGLHGIGIYSSSAFVTINKIFSYDNKRSGCRICGNTKDIFIQKSEYLNNFQYGILINKQADYPGTNRNILIRDNVIKSNFLYGIYSNNAKNLTLKSNIIEKNNRCMKQKLISRN